MAADFRFIVVGRGMMGAAAARHLANQTDGVAVIGPDEPEDRASHQGVFGSHYDEGRITRTIDPDTNWARLANRSISRYADIERDSGIQFYAPVGCLVVGPERGGEIAYVGDVVEAARRLGVQTDILDDAELKVKFPFFSFASGSEGVFEPHGAGHISPRRLVRHNPCWRKRQARVSSSRRRCRSAMRVALLSSRRRKAIHSAPKDIARRRRFLHCRESLAATC